MSTLVLDPTAVKRIGHVALGLAYCNHITPAWQSTGATGNIYGALPYAWREKNRPDEVFNADIIHRALDMLYVLNQRAYTTAYGKNHDAFFRPTRIKLASYNTKNGAPSRAMAIDAYKQLQCLAYNLDQYSQREDVKQIIDAFKTAFTYYIIDESAEYKSAAWGA